MIAIIDVLSVDVSRSVLRGNLLCFVQKNYEAHQKSLWRRADIHIKKMSFLSVSYFSETCYKTCLDYI